MRLLYPQKNAPPLDKLEDLAGKEVYVGKGTSYVKHLQELNSRLTSANIQPVKIIEADPKLVTEDILEMVNAGIIHYSVADSHLARIMVFRSP